MCYRVWVSRYGWPQLSVGMTSRTLMLLMMQLVKLLITVSTLSQLLLLDFYELYLLTISCDFFVCIPFLCVRTEVDDVVLEFNINYKRQFFLSGGPSRKFQILSKISAESNVRILIPKRENSHSTQAASLEGSWENVMK